MTDAFRPAPASEAAPEQVPATPLETPPGTVTPLQRRRARRDLARRTRQDGRARLRQRRGPLRRARGPRGGAVLALSLIHI